MPTLLSVIASPRGGYSVSTALLNDFVSTFQASHADATVVTRDLNTTDLPFVSLPWIMGAFTPPETHSAEMTEAIAVSDKLVAELQAADHIVIGTPMYNFAVPAILKAYIDHIVRVGVTVSASYEGLLKNKKATLIVASGGNYAPGSHMESYNFETAYLKHILAFIGITDVTIIMAGGTNDVTQGKTTQEAFVATFAPQVESAAK